MINDVMMMMTDDEWWFIIMIEDSWMMNDDGGGGTAMKLPNGFRVVEGRLEISSGMLWFCADATASSCITDLNSIWNHAVLCKIRFLFFCKRRVRVQRHLPRWSSGTSPLLCSVGKLGGLKKGDIRGSPSRSEPNKSMEQTAFDPNSFSRTLRRNDMFQGSSKAWTMRKSRGVSWVSMQANVQNTLIIQIVLKYCVIA